MKVAKLFENQEDLLAEFGQFLPDAKAVTKPAQYALHAAHAPPHAAHARSPLSPPPPPPHAAQVRHAPRRPATPRAAPPASDSDVRVAAGGRAVRGHLPAARRAAHLARARAAARAPRAPRTHRTRSSCRARRTRRAHRQRKYTHTRQLLLIPNTPNTKHDLYCNSLYSG